MYTQSYKTNNNKTNIVSFPNKDSIMQMKALSERNESGKENDYAKANDSIKTSDNTYFDTILLLGALLGISDSEISAGVFPLIAGIILSL